MPSAGCGLVGKGSSDCCRRGDRSCGGHRAVSQVRRDCWSSESSFQSHFRRSTYAPGELSELQVIFLVPPGSPVCPQRSQQLLQPCCRVSSLDSKHLVCMCLPSGGLRAASHPSGVPIRQPRLLAATLGAPSAMLMGGCHPFTCKQKGLSQALIASDLPQHQ